MNAALPAAAAEDNDQVTRLPRGRGSWRSPLLPADEALPDRFPAMRNLSSGHLYEAMIRPERPDRPDYVALSELAHPTMELIGAVGQWNMVWEAAQFRRRFFDLDELPPAMAKVAELGDINVVFVPRTRSRYYEYAPLLHMLPRRTLERFGLPLLKGGMWPFLAATEPDLEDALPVDFHDRLGRAWASTVWHHVDSGSGLRAFTRDEPLQLLAHNLDFWLPAATEMIQRRLRAFPEVEKKQLPTEIPLEGGGVLEGAVPGHPRAGGDVWSGEDDARDAVAETVNAADRGGQLRAIIDAVRSHRVVDDFSERWSYAREDFERKLYRKRSRVGVRFVELTDTLAVQGPESEVIGRAVTNDFLALLDPRNRQIVVLLNSGITSRTEIAERLGYANHSAVSKRLAQIRQKAVAFFDQL